MSCFGLVPRVRIYFVDLIDFLPKPANETGVRPMKSRHLDFVETFFEKKREQYKTL